MADTKAIKKLKTLLDEQKESVKSLADKLGVARGTLNALLAGTSEPRLGVILAAEKKFGIKQGEWS